MLSTAKNVLVDIRRFSDDANRDLAILCPIQVTRLTPPSGPDQRACVSYQGCSRHLSETPFIGFRRDLIPAFSTPIIDAKL